MIDRRFRPVGIPIKKMAIALSLGGVCYVGYFVCTAFAVKLAGPALPPVIIGLMPVILAITANRRERAFDWRRLILPLAMIVVGLLLVNIATIGAIGAPQRNDVMFGTGFAVLALLIWVVYGMANSAVMRATDAPDGMQWTGLQGIGAAIGSMMLLPFTSLGETSGDLGNFIAWSLLMGVAGSWLATWFWVIASRRLPLALAAQLIVAETVFGLLYGFIYEQRWPLIWEWAGCALQVAGVCRSIALLTSSPTQNGRITPAVDRWVYRLLRFRRRSGHPN